jgi:hypothetical protein
MILDMKMEVYLTWYRQKYSQNWRLTVPQDEVFACPQTTKSQKLRFIRVLQQVQPTFAISHVSSCFLFPS